MNGDGRDGDGRAGLDGDDPLIRASRLFEQVAQRPQYLLACGHTSYSVTACFDCLVQALVAGENRSVEPATTAAGFAPRELKIAVTYPPHVMHFRIPRWRR